MNNIIPFPKLGLTKKGLDRLMQEQGPSVKQKYMQAKRALAIYLEKDHPEIETIWKLAGEFSHASEQWTSFWIQKAAKYRRKS